MKKAILAVLASVSIAGCSGMKTVEERKSYAIPTWYAECQQSSTTGWFWWKKELANACGGGESAYAQAAEEQMYAIAMNNFAKRINSEVNSETKIEFKDDKKSTYTKISYVVKDTVIREHLRTETAHFTMKGKHYTFVRLSMPKDIFEQLIAEAKSKTVSQ
jgi:hypothetical protein